MKAATNGRVGPLPTIVTTREFKKLDAVAVVRQSFMCLIYREQIIFQASSIYPCFFLFLNLMFLTTIVGTALRDTQMNIFKIHMYH